MSSCSRAAARATDSVRARTRAMAWFGAAASSPSTDAQRSRRAAASSSNAASAASSSARSGAPPASSSASAVTSSLARRAASASSVETTSTSAAASSAATTPRPRSRSTPVRPRARSTSPWTRPNALARSSSRRDELGRGRGRLRVERVQRLVQLALLVAADGEVLCRRRPPGAQVGLLGAGRNRRTVSSSVATLSCDRAAAACRSSGRIWRRTSRTRSPRRSRFSAVPARRRSARSGDAGASARPPPPR